MHSFTPFYNPRTPFLQSNFFSWLSLTSWNPNPFMMMSVKNIQINNQKNISQPFLQKKIACVTEKTTCNLYQEDYSPEKQLQGFQNQERKGNSRIQCKGRNDYSNILKAFIHLIKTNNTLKEKIKFIIERKQYSLTYQKFLMKIRRKFSKGKTYISPKQILTFIKTCSECNEQSEKAIGEVFKIILKSFLSIQYVLCLIKNFKGKKQSRKDLISKTRQLSKIIFYQGLINDNL